jgi:hypothetical protein
MAALAIRERRSDRAVSSLGSGGVMPLLLGIVDLIGGRGRHQTLCIDDPLP